ncbi:unnamed protein product [Lepidochelys kempii]
MLKAGHAVSWLESSPSSSEQPAVCLIIGAVLRQSTGSLAWRAKSLWDKVIVLYAWFATNCGTEEAWSTWCLFPVCSSIEKFVICKKLGCICYMPLDFLTLESPHVPPDKCYSRLERPGFPLWSSTHVYKELSRN